MRLLNVYTQKFQTFDSTIPPPYAIGSHRWTSNETTHRKFHQACNAQSAGNQKVQDFCKCVRAMNEKLKRSPAWAEMGFQLSCEWFWIDTACIDKTDGTELSESINSMFAWYRAARVCYAYLADVRSIRDFQGAMLDFMHSEWFTRGWTLQELLAPGIVVFLTKEWEPLGHKCIYDKPLCDVVCRGLGQRLDFILSCITKIPLAIIRDFANSDNMDVEEKMIWARDRVTSREEDRAYCLLGICGVFMSPIYGEGGRSWERLQAAIREERQRKLVPMLNATSGRPEDFVAFPTPKSARSHGSPTREIGAALIQRGQSLPERRIWDRGSQTLNIYKIGLTPRSKTDAHRAPFRVVPRIHTINFDDNPSSLITDHAKLASRGEERLLSPVSLAQFENLQRNRRVPTMMGRISIDPKDLGQWIGGARRGLSSLKCTYCHGILYAGPIVQCSTKDCKRQLFHRRCAGLSDSDYQESNWHCRECELTARPRNGSHPGSTSWNLTQESDGVTKIEIDAFPARRMSQLTIKKHLDPLLQLPQRELDEDDSNDRSFTKELAHSRQSSSDRTSQTEDSLSPNIRKAPTSIEQLIEDIVSRRLAAEMKAWTEARVNEGPPGVMSEEQPTKTPRNEGQHTESLSPPTQSSKKPRFDDRGKSAEKRSSCFTSAKDGPAEPGHIEASLSNYEGQDPVKPRRGLSLLKWRGNVALSRLRRQKPVDLLAGQASIHRPDRPVN